MSWSVGNLHRGALAAPDAVYVGRGGRGLARSPLANPYRIDPKRARREQSDAIERYRAWLWRCLHADTPARREIDRLAALPDGVLVCFCSPAACHADVISRAIDWWRAEARDVVVTLTDSLGVREGFEDGGRTRGLGRDPERRFHVGRPAPRTRAGARIYVVADGRLRGYAPLVGLEHDGRGVDLVGDGDVRAVSIPERISGFPGFRYRRWNRADERPLPTRRETGAATLDLPEVEAPEPAA